MPPVPPSLGSFKYMGVISHLPVSISSLVISLSSFPSQINTLLPTPHKLKVLSASSL